MWQFLISSSASLEKTLSLEYILFAPPIQVSSTRSSSLLSVA